MRSLCNLTIVSSIFFILTSCADNQNFSGINNAILDTSSNLLKISQNIRGGAQNNSSETKDTSISKNKSSNKKTSISHTSKNTTSTALKTQLFNDCIENSRTKLRFDMGKSLEQINAEKEREKAYITKYCTCTLPYEEEAANKLISLGFDGSRESINKMQKDPVKKKKINDTLIKLSMDKTENCSSQ